ncbi:tachykinin family protein [Diplodia corticola]|uniref:Tachykinin family protein n=1 Tax=Diplodia corticola TaxID=236234 RepID=A0A1J9RJ40_9PEZI|nr:tachykinin family protein [Diplodia corticola]OJD40473.1 tachykinin family protein [Diplodia corticola]
MPCVSRDDAKMDAEDPERALPAAAQTPTVARSSTSPDAHGNASSTNKPPRKRKRKPRPPPAQPGLRWLNSTDPSQFRDARVRKTVRSHVMYDHAARKKTSAEDPIALVHLCRHSNAPAHHHDDALVPAPLAARHAAEPPAEDGNHLAISLLDRLASHLDPLGQLPGFAAPKQHVRELQQFCVEYFASTIYRVAPIENSNIFLAGMCMASARLDVLRGLPRESATTAAVKLEAVRLLNHSLSNPSIQLNDETIMILTRVLHSEVIHGNFAVLEVHKKGLERIVQLRGGFQRLYNDSPASRWLCNAIVHVVYQACIHTEQQPAQIFLDWKPATYDLSVPPDEQEADKAIHLPDRIWASLVKDYRCSKYTAELLEDLREAVDLILSPNNTEETVSGGEGSARHDAQSVQARSFLMNRILSKPSAEDPESPVFGDWYYESLRILSHIYANAFFHMVPFSVAAILASDTLIPSRLLSVPERLKATIEKTHPDPNHCWGPSMTRVLLWMTVVGGAAANPLASQVTERDVRAKLCPGLETARRYLISLGLRSTIVLACQSPYSPAHVLDVLRKVIQIQGQLPTQRPEIEMAGFGDRTQGQGPELQLTIPTDAMGYSGENRRGSAE